MKLTITYRREQDDGHWTEVDIEAKVAYEYVVNSHVVDFYHFTAVRVFDGTTHYSVPDELVRKHTGESLGLDKSDWDCIDQMFIDKALESVGQRYSYPD